MTIEQYNLQTFKPKGYPVRHKRKVPFTPAISVPQDFISRRRKIRELDLELDRFILSAKDYMDLVIDAYSSNVHWSTMLEGNPLRENQVRKITHSTFSGDAPSPEMPAGPQQEIINHLTCLMPGQPMKMPWDHEFVQIIHDILLQGTGAKFKPKAYRKTHGSVKTSTGMEAFIACPPSSIKEEMSSLLFWLNNSAPAYDSIAAATVFFHEFESIHPFTDGNGRTGRCLFHLFLQTTDLPNSHLCKIESELLSDEELYYQLLAYTDDSGSYEALIDHVSDSILRSYERSHQHLSEKDLLSSELDEVTKRLLKMAKRWGKWFAVSDAAKWVSSSGAQTVRNKLNSIVDLGALNKKGRTQSCRYRIRNPLEDVRAILQNGKKEG